MAKDAPAAPNTGKAILLRFRFEARFECAMVASSHITCGQNASKRNSSFHELIQFNSPRSVVMAARWWCSIRSISFPKSSRDMSNDTSVRRRLETSWSLNGAGRTFTRKFAA